MSKIQTFELWGSIVCHKIPDPERDWELLELINIKESDRLLNIIESIWEKIVLVLWWDGTLLQAVREHYPKWIPFLGENFWTKWFLLHDKGYISTNTTYTSREYPLLDVSANGKHLWVAFNEVFIGAMRTQFHELLVTVNNESEAKFWWDGIIIATPAGSTAHNTGHYWPILPHDSSWLILTPVGNTSSSSYLQNTDIIRIQNIWRLPSIFINLDSDKSIPETKEWEKILYEVKLSQHKVNFLIANDYLNKWDMKVREEQWFKPVTSH